MNTEDSVGANELYQIFLELIQDSDPYQAVTALAMALGGAIAAASLTTDAPLAIVLTEFDRAKAEFERLNTPVAPKKGAN